MATKKPLAMEQGSTFSQVIRWETSPIMYKSITAITKTAPARITCPAHGVPDGWRVAVVSVLGMTQINATNEPPKDADYVLATVVDPNTLELNTVNSSLFTAYKSGGYVQYNAPKTLTGYTARMQIRDKVGGTLLLSNDVADAPLNLIDVSVNDAAYTITVTVPASVTDTATWTTGVYTLDMISPAGVVTTLLYGKISNVINATD